MRNRLCALLLASALTVLGACADRALYVRPGEVPSCPECLATSSRLDQRLILIGDTGELDDAQPALAAFASEAGRDPGRTIAVFLGDNIYPRGLPAPGEVADPDTDEAEQALRILQQQVEVIERAGVRSVFVPGNHDWDRSGVRGLGRIQAQADVLASSKNAVMYPPAGCPGPTVLDVGDYVRLIVLDTEWLLRDELPKETSCTWGDPAASDPLAGETNAAVYAALNEAIAGAGTRRVLLTTHHPLKTLGSHGGRYSAKDYLFPLTHVASWLYLPVPFLYPALRTWIVRSDQDLGGGRNQQMVASIEAALRTADSSPIVASGHEHSLQVFDDPADSIWYLVSGSGAKTEATGHRGGTVFKRAALGLMVLDVHTDGRIGLRVIEVGDGESETIFERWLDDRRGGGE